MSQPVFPVEFVDKLCPKVKEARKWRLIYVGGTLNITPEDRKFAECAPEFTGAGNWVRCENCTLAAPLRINEFVIRDKVRDYYQQVKDEERILLNLGAGI
jgi:hypothetical protein